MINSWLRNILLTVILFSLLAGVLTLNSSRFNPDPSGDTEFIARAQQKAAPGIAVSASALGRQESRRSFGEDLGKYDIQPIWLSIKNDTDDQLLLLSIATDPFVEIRTMSHVWRCVRRNVACVEIRIFRELVQRIVSREVT